MNSVDRTVVALVLLRFNAKGRRGTTWPTATLLHDSTPSRPLAHRKSTRREYAAVGFVRQTCASAPRFDAVMPIGSWLRFAKIRCHPIPFSGREFGREFREVGFVSSTTARRSVGSFGAFLYLDLQAVRFVRRIFAARTGGGWALSSRFKCPPMARGSRERRRQDEPRASFGPRIGHITPVAT
jgi:hypothetical protein